MIKGRGGWISGLLVKSVGAVCWLWFGQRVADVNRKKERGHLLTDAGID